MINRLLYVATATALISVVMFDETFAANVARDLGEEAAIMLDPWVAGFSSRSITLRSTPSFAQPSGEGGTEFAVPCHTENQTRRGLWNLENVDTKSLIDAKVYEGAFIWAPLRIVGGTGSPGNPVVLY